MSSTSRLVEVGRFVSVSMGRKMPLVKELAVMMTKRSNRIVNRKNVYGIENVRDSNPRPVISV